MNKSTCIAECDTLGHSLKQVHIIIYIRHQYTWSQAETSTYNYIYTTSTVINYALRSFSAKHKERE